MHIPWFTRRPATAVLIDMPNVQNENRPYSDRRLHIAWGALRAHIQKQLRGTDVVLKAGFHRPDRDPKVVERWQRQAQPHWKKDGYVLVPYHKRDVDSGVSYWMYRSAKLALDKKAKRLTIILVSGDAVYAEVFRALQEDYRGQLALTLVVYSWGVYTLSRELALLAGKGNIHYLDQVPGLVRTSRPLTTPTS